MRIGILEIESIGHLTMVVTLCEIFCNDQKNEVFVFSLNRHVNTLKYLNKKLNIKFINYNEQEDIYQFLLNTNNFKLDSLYIVTLESEDTIRTLNKTNFNTKTYTVIHDIDIWFQLTYYQHLKIYCNNFLCKRNYRHIFKLIFKLIFGIKNNINFTYQLKQYVNKSIKRQCFFVVLSTNIKNELEKLINYKYIKVIPFSIFTPDSLERKKGITNNKLRICVLGYVTQVRRDYLGLISIMENYLVEYKDLFQVDMLGGVQDQKLPEKFDILNDKGFNIIYYNESYLTVEKTDIELQKADIILGNSVVRPNKYSIYGKTKESGTPFAMIKSAKPGLFPFDYQTLPELKSSILYYKNNIELANIIIELIINRNKLQYLEEEAIKNSLKFTANSIIQRM